MGENEYYILPHKNGLQLDSVILATGLVWKCFWSRARGIDVERIKNDDLLRYVQYSDREQIQCSRIILVPHHIQPSNGRQFGMCGGAGSPTSQLPPVIQVSVGAVLQNLEIPYGPHALVKAK